MTIRDAFLYRDVATTCSWQTALAFDASVEKEIIATWQEKKEWYGCVNILSCGLGHLFQRPLLTKPELDMRLAYVRKQASRIHTAVTRIQREFLRKKYQHARDVQQSVQKLSTSKVEGSTFGQLCQLGRVWFEKKSIDTTNGLRGQVIWQKVTSLGAELKKKGFYVFYHAHSYPITLHLELTSFFQSQTRSIRVKGLQPQELRRKFRAPLVGEYFTNTEAYLKSDIGRRINSGMSMDDHYRETILSVDAIEINQEAYESAQHFFKSNRSIVDTATSTGQSSRTFDLAFIKNHLETDSFQEYAVELFSRARSALSRLPGYGMIRVIAIAKNTLENPKTNYVWRAHAFGRLCRCTHTPGKFGHQEFVATLKKHQEGIFSKCSTLSRPYPQYRILAKSLDRDTTKQIYTMDCLTEREQKMYQGIYEDLKNKIVRIRRLEALLPTATYEQVLTALLGIDHTEGLPHYKHGLHQHLIKNRATILKYYARLKMDLPAPTDTLLQTVLFGK